MKINIYTSCAGIAGDPHKLFIAETKCDIKEYEMYNQCPWFNLSFSREKRS